MEAKYGLLALWPGPWFASDHGPTTPMHIYLIFIIGIGGFHVAALLVMLLFVPTQPGLIALI